MNLDFQDAMKNVVEGYYCEDCNQFLSKADYAEHNGDHSTLKETMIEGWRRSEIERLESQASTRDCPRVSQQEIADSVELRYLMGQKKAEKRQDSPRGDNTN